MDSNADFSATWHESIAQCLELVDEKRYVAEAEYWKRATTVDDPASLAAPDDWPEKPDDPIGDGLCRLDPEGIEEATHYVESFLDKLDSETQGMSLPDAQRCMLELLRNELQDHMFFGTPESSFGLLLSTLVELEDCFVNIAVSKQPHSGAELQRRFFTPISQYCELAEGTMFAMEKMLHYHQRQMGWPPETWENDLFSIAEQQLIEEGQLPRVANDSVLSDKNVDLCGARAMELFTDMLEPYAQVLPNDYCPELAWFIQQISDARTPAPGRRPAGNDNDYAMDQKTFERILSDMSRIFLDHLDAATDPMALLKAAKDAERLIGGSASVASFAR